ncbi:MAG: PIN domain-containing protein [Nitrospinae bacterium]|nr:PIN domain-containing protein [Nitrospinota bacterium]
MGKYGSQGRHGGIALENKRDIHYNEAIIFRNEIKEKKYRPYTSNFILDETYTLLLANVGYKKTIDFAKKIWILKNNGLLHIIQVSEEIENCAWSIFEKFNRDKLWSYTDCTTKAIMEMLNINEVFTFDRDFEQMGFVKKP